MTENEIYLGLIVVGIIVIGILIYGYVNSCPECKKWFSRNLDNKEEIDRSSGYETVTRNDVTKNNEGKEVSRTQRKEQVRMTYYTYRNYYSCSACKNEWTEISEDKVEG